MQVLWNRVDYNTNMYYIVAVDTTLFKFLYLNLMYYKSINNFNNKYFKLIWRFYTIFLNLGIDEFAIWKFKLDHVAILNKYLQNVSNNY